MLLEGIYLLSMLQVTDAESAKNTNVIFKENKCKVFLKAILVLWLKHKVVGCGQSGGSCWGKNELFVRGGDDIVFPNVLKINFISKSKIQAGKWSYGASQIMIILIFISTRICVVKIIINLNW